MGLGNTAKKLQKVVDVADDLYSKMSDLREQMVAIRETIDRTDERVAELEEKVDRQRRLLEAIADAEGVDVEAYRETDETDSTE